MKCQHNDWESRWQCNRPFFIYTISSRASCVYIL